MNNLHNGVYYAYSLNSREFECKFSLHEFTDKATNKKLINDDKKADV
jgi:hypothetical protein